MRLMCADFIAVTSSALKQDYFWNTINWHKFSSNWSPPSVLLSDTNTRQTREDWEEGSNESVTTRRRSKLYVQFLNISGFILNLKQTSCFSYQTYKKPEDTAIILRTRIECEENCLFILNREHMQFLQEFSELLLASKRYSLTESTTKTSVLVSLSF